MGRSSKREDWREREALFRYGLVREAASERLSPRERGQLVRALAGRPASCARLLARPWTTGSAPTAAAASRR